jgi:molybdenum-dependent DNA-binding transcriptional regulator ModE
MKRKPGPPGRPAKFSLVRFQRTIIETGSISETAKRIGMSREWAYHLAGKLGIRLKTKNHRPSSSGKLRITDTLRSALEEGCAFLAAAQSSGQAFHCSGKCSGCLLRWVGIG